MGEQISIVWTGLLALTFVALTLHKRNNAWGVLAAVFVVLSARIRLSIPVDAVRDFAPYFASFQEVKFGNVPSELIFEPYRLVLFKFILLFNGLDSFEQIRLTYYLHFIAVTAFFLWLAYLRDVSAQVKLILFLAFYPVLAFVWIQAGAAYVTACVLFLAIANRSKFSFLHYLLPLVHSAMTPLLVVMKVKDLRPFGKALAVGGLIVVGYLALESSYAQHILGILDYYAQSADRRTSESFLLFHLANIVAFVALAATSVDFRKNFPVMVLMGIYLAAYQVNPVIGARLFPLVLIACLVQRIDIPRRMPVTLMLALMYLPVYFARFDQVFSGVRT